MNLLGQDLYLGGSIQELSGAGSREDIVNGDSTDVIEDVLVANIKQNKEREILGVVSPVGFR